MLNFNTPAWGHSIVEARLKLIELLIKTMHHSDDKLSSSLESHRCCAIYGDLFARTVLLSYRLSNNIAQANRDASLLVSEVFEDMRDYGSTTAILYRTLEVDLSDDIFWVMYSGIAENHPDKLRNVLLRDFIVLEYLRDTCLIDASVPLEDFESYIAALLSNQLKISEELTQ